MHVTYACSHCDRTTRAEFDEASAELTCLHCGDHRKIPAGAVTPDGLSRCLVCPSEDLFTRKDFPQRLGAGIVAAGLAASCIPWYFHSWYGTFAILFATATIDLVLYVFMGDMLQCYRCQAQYHGVAGGETHSTFSLETHERHRQQQARLGAHSSPHAPRL